MQPLHTRFHSIPLLLLTGCLLASCSIFRTSAPEAEPAAASANDYERIVTAQAVTSRGLFDVHRVGDRIYYEIPDSLLGRDMLMVSRVAQVPTDFHPFYTAGARTAEQVLAFERVRDKILIRERSYTQVAADSLPIHESVRINNFEPIIASFDLEARNPDTGASVIRIDEFFSRDVHAITGIRGFLRNHYRVRTLDPQRSYIDTIRTYPRNIETGHVMTYEAADPPSSPQTLTISLYMNQSMILLPEEPMRPRLADHRIGWLTLEQIDFGSDRQRAEERSLIRRWRLEPADPDAYARGEPTPPVNPIVFYVDPATPHEYRPWVVKGIEQWNEAFEKAGFLNAVQARLPPSAEEDPDFRPEDIRYNTVRWSATRTRNAVGPSTVDPRTGEIIASDIFWFHNHTLTYRNLLMIETGAANPAARSLRVDPDYLGEAIRQVIAHEVGHAIGLSHNMIAAAAFEPDSLRSASFTERYGVSASIMDYARQNYIAQPGDGVTRFIRKIGPYDRYAVNWGYRLIAGAATPEEERPTLDRWIRERADDPRYRFLPLSPHDPRAQMEALSSDNVRAGTYGLENLKRVVPRLHEWAVREGESYRELSGIYNELISVWNRYVHHVITNIGGVHENRKSAGQEGTVYSPVEAERQREAMAFLQENAFTTPHWLLDQTVLDRIEASGSIHRIRSMQERFMDRLLDADRIERLIEAEAVHGPQSYTLREMIEGLYRAVWIELESGESIDPFRRNLQRTWIDRASSRLDSDRLILFERAGASDLRPLFRNQLIDLREALRSALREPPDEMTRLHLQDLFEEVSRLLDPN